MQSLALILLVNYTISWWNAYATGKSWVEAKAVGGWIRVVAWAGAVLSAAGFSTVYLFLIAYGAHVLGYIDDQSMKLALSFGNLGLITPMIGAGIVVTLESWRRAYRHPSLLSLGSAGWNTYATAHNALSAFEDSGDALDMIGEAYTSAIDSKSKAVAVALITAIAIALFALVAGALQAAFLIRKYAATDPIPAVVANHVASLHPSRIVPGGTSR
jgi:hypothetical protein